jgi:hypothetical protein
MDDLPNDLTRATWLIASLFFVVLASGAGFALSFFAR